MQEDSLLWHASPRPLHPIGNLQGMHCRSLTQVDLPGAQATGFLEPIFSDGTEIAASPVVEEMGRLLSGFADCICCGRGNRYQSADAWMNQPLNIFQPRSTATLEDLLEKSSRAREAVWQQLGSLEPLVLSHLVSPTLSGGPKWPALRQAFRLVRRPNGNVILASDGLSDPFDDITLGTYRSRLQQSSHKATLPRTAQTCLVGI